uniref:GDSL esterase/lipase n=1 Tax=Aegilops tauschii subsp. strangulata TaxID=200361 RepID=A0A453DQY0_AEGTS
MEEIIFHWKLKLSAGGIYREILPNPENLISKALYTLDIGQNDLTVGYFDNMTTKQVEAYVPDLMERISSAIQTVYNLGGRYFWVHNTAPLGCLPYALAFRPDLAAAEKDAAGCSVELNTGAQFFNARLNETVARLRETLPGAALTYVDVYAAKYRLISQARKLGFGDPLRVCCGYGGGEYNFDRDIRCGDKMEVNGTSVLAGKPCEDPSRSVSWDGVHFTEAANKFVFDQIVDGALSDPPVPLRRACQAKGQ